MALIKLTDSELQFEVDNEDADKCQKLSWSLGGRENKQIRAWKNKYIILTYYLLNFTPEEGIRIDHKDRNYLNNKKSNFRICTISQNNANSKIRKNKDSKYRGVYKITKGNYFYARISINGIGKYLGTFITEKEAAIAYNNAAIKAFGEFATLNDIS